MRRLAVVDARETFAGDPDIEVVSSLPGWIHLRIATSIELIERVGSFVRAELSYLPAQVCEELSLAVDELISNSMEHGCRLDAGCVVDFKIIRTSRMLLFQVQDGGEGFSIESLTHAAVNNPPEEPLRHAQQRDEMGLRPGGFGILLVKKIADELLYNELGNEVTLVKYLDGF
jgi:anti-sigma regulatory factor (Ser/Thr protein kinase)